MLSVLVSLLTPRKLLTKTNVEPDYGNINIRLLEIDLRWSWRSHCAAYILKITSQRIQVPSSLINTLSGKLQFSYVADNKPLYKFVVVYAKMLFQVYLKVTVR